MPKNTESINKELDDLLTSNGFKVTARDSDGEVLPVPDSADILEFHFHKNGKDYGTVIIAIDGLKHMIVGFDNTVADSGSGEKGGTSWLSLIKLLKKFAFENRLTFKLNDIDRVRKDMKRRKHNERLSEGYYGNRKISYSDDTPTVKMIIKHNRQLEETDQRFRHIERIFLETGTGERFQAPTNKPSQARMFARHLAEGGDYRDDRWNHLQEICEDIGALGGFVRATQRGKEQFNENVDRMITEATEKYQQLRETVKRLSTGRGYNKYFESYEPSVITETDDNLSDLFRHSSIDQRIERALPVLKKFGIQNREVQEAQMFETWADSFLQEALMPMTKRQEDELIKILVDQELQVGPNGEVAISMLDDIIDSDDLDNELRAAAKQDSNNDAVAIIKSWMSRQNSPVYDKILDRLEQSYEEEPAPETDVKEPEVEAPPEKQEELPEPTEEPTEPTPPEEPAADDQSQLPSLPPPPLKESDELDSLKRLLRI
jgi:hypothetical protein